MHWTRKHKQPSVWRGAPAQRWCMNPALRRKLLSDLRAAPRGRAALQRLLSLAEMRAFLLFGALTAAACSGAGGGAVSAGEAGPPPFSGSSQAVGPLAPLPPRSPEPGELFVDQGLEAQAASTSGTATRRA